MPEAQVTLGSIILILGACGGGYLLSELGRDLGKARESKLFKMWGGKPTTVALRHGGTLNPVLLQRQHGQIHDVTGIKLASAKEEKADPKAADDTYETAVSALREMTRDPVRFPLVFEENRSFGFRRNLWGFKPLGVGQAHPGDRTLSIPVAEDLAAHQRRKIPPHARG